MLGIRSFSAKLIILSLVIIYLSGCQTTKGISDSSLESTKPYHLEYKGSLENAFNEVKRIIVRNGFSIQNDDSKAGILTTNPKLLDRDERFYSWSPFAPFTQNESGRLSFVFTQETSEKVKIEFYAKITTEEKDYRAVENGLKYEGKSVAEKSAEQGHPLPMKFRKIFEEAGLKII